MGAARPRWRLVTAGNDGVTLPNTVVGPGKIIDVSNPPKALEAGRGKDEGAWWGERFGQVHWLHWMVLVVLLQDKQEVRSMVRSVRQTCWFYVTPPKKFNRQVAFSLWRLILSREPYM